MPKKTAGEKLRNWLFADPERQAKLRALVPATTFDRYTKGEAPLEVKKMLKTRRAELYQLTGIEDFKFKGYEQHLPKDRDNESSSRGEDLDPGIKLDDIARSLNIMSSYIAKIGGKYTPTTNERINSVNDSLENLYNHMQYFASENTPEQERVKLADAIDPNCFGLLWNVIEGIIKDPKSPEVFARWVISQGIGNPRISNIKRGLR